MNSALLIVNEQNKTAQWAARITECRNSGLSVYPDYGSLDIPKPVVFQWGL